MGCLPLKWQRPHRGRLSCAGARFLFVFGVYTPCGRRISGVFGTLAGGPAPLVAERLPDADAAFRHDVADRSGMDSFIRVHLVRVFLRKALELALQFGVEKIAHSIDDDESSIAKFAVLGALTLYLDFINLFLRLLQIFGKKR